MNRKVVVVGQGYVGVPLAMLAVDAGYDVVGFDIDSARIKRLIASESYVDDVTDAQLDAAHATCRFLPSTNPIDCVGFDIALITVPTPLREGTPDLSYVESAARILGPLLRRGSLVILESTSYPGTTEELVAPILEASSGLLAGADFFLGYSPERIDPGNPDWHVGNTPKVVSGVDRASLDAVKSFYDTIVERTVVVKGTKEAELTKLLENTYRHVNVALANEFAMFAHDLGIDIWDVVDAAASKPFGFQRFTPGPGVGGHCLPIDPSYLSWRVERSVGRPFRFVELANDINEHMPDYVVKRLGLVLNRQRKSINGSRVLLLGLAYKRNSGDARESPGLAVATQLLQLGADVVAADPHIVEEHIELSLDRVELTIDEIAAADVVVLLTDHDVFDRDAIVTHARSVLDTRHCLVGDQVEYL